MWCDFNDESTDEDQCRECDRTHCHEYKKIMSRDATIEEVNNEELLASARKDIQERLCLNDEQTDKLIAQFSGNINKLYRAKTQTYLTALVEVSARDLVTDELRAQIDGLLKQAITERVLSYTDKAVELKTIQQLVAEKVRTLFASNDSRGRKVIADTVDGAIKNEVSRQVADALDEIKAETIDKYNKDVLKIMMQGMANAIGADKRLLGMMTEQ